MAKKNSKTATKKTTSASKTGKKTGKISRDTEIPESLRFKSMSDNPSKEEQLDVFQHNITVLFNYTEVLANSTALDAKDSEVIATIARINLAERKMTIMGLKINSLILEIEKSKPKNAEVVNQ